MNATIWLRVFGVFLESAIYAGVVAALLFTSVFYLEPQTVFARRWDGSCSGWTKPVALLHVFSDLVIWYVYVAIAVAIIRLHPILRRVPGSRYTVTLITCVFVTCGLTHLFEAYATFYPAYVCAGYFKLLTAIIGVVGATFICHNLITVFAVIKKERRRLELRLEGRGDV